MNKDTFSIHYASTFAYMRTIMVYDLCANNNGGNSFRAFKLHKCWFSSDDEKNSYIINGLWFVHYFYLSKHTGESKILHFIQQYSCDVLTDQIPSAGLAIRFQ